MFLLLLIYGFIPLWLEKVPDVISVLKLLRLVLWPNVWSALEVFCVPLGGMCILLLMDRIFCVYLLGLFGPIQKFSAMFYILIFCLGDLSIVEHGVLKSSAVTILLSLSPLRSVPHILLCMLAALWYLGASFFKWIPIILFASHFCLSCILRMNSYSLFPSGSLMKKTFWSFLWIFILVVIYSVFLGVKFLDWYKVGFVRTCCCIIWNTSQTVWRIQFFHILINVWYCLSFILDSVMVYIDAHYDFGLHYRYD